MKRMKVNFEGYLYFSIDDDTDIETAAVKELLRAEICVNERLSSRLHVKDTVTSVKEI